MNMKVCPKCKEPNHTTNLRCDCGHEFSRVGPTPCVQKIQGEPESDRSSENESPQTTANRAEVPDDKRLRPRFGLLCAVVPPGLKLLGAGFGWDIFQWPWIMVLGLSAFMFLWGLFWDWKPEPGVGGG